MQSLSPDCQNYINDWQIIIWWAKGIFLWQGGGGNKIITNHFILTLNNDNASLRMIPMMNISEMWWSWQRSLWPGMGVSFWPTWWTENRETISLTSCDPSTVSSTTSQNWWSSIPRFVVLFPQISEIGLMTCSLYQCVIS